MKSIQNSALFFAAFVAVQSAVASVELNYNQSPNFWSIYKRLKSGITTANEANTLLNALYGVPEGDEIVFRYFSPIPKSNFGDDVVSVSDFRINQSGYVYATNPILPHLYAWAGVGPELTLRYRFLEIYGGKYWAKE